MGRVAIVPDNIRRGIINQALLKLTPSNAVLPEFLKYWMDSTDFQDSLNEQSGGAAIQNVASVAILKEIQISLPALPEQKRIVGLLDEAFEGIATAHANAETNLQSARALFESFHDSVFSRKHENWAEKTLGEVCEYANGKAHEQCIDKDGRFFVINSKFISTDGEVFKQSHEALLLLQPDDIAMVLSDVPNGKALAKCFLVEEADTYTLNQRICLIRSTTFHTKFLFYQINRNKHFLSFNNGENQTNLRLNQVLSCPLFLPPLVEQKAIADKLDAMSEETQRLASIYERKLAALEALTKSLLHQAFTGEL
jgi:type I restriction enzyme S subunit